uniref:DUF389 domain-containing protein n=1 Tax=Phaeomonas parva TaxID=124430 RepID=A0A7S1U9S5_9STRA|mmetsp:Transcript_38090/g.119550  ORF Transcript_38090/g.119550 Transcript_38090/m.119550 type:complete len:336 (+) Transcript_38090:98-1105(+)
MKLLQFSADKWQEDELNSFLDATFLAESSLVFHTTDGRLQFQVKCADGDLLDLIEILENFPKFKLKMDNCTVMDIHKVTNKRDRRRGSQWDAHSMSEVAGKSPAALWLGQVITNVGRQTVLSFDMIVLLCISSIVAGLGLATSNRTLVVASMLMSPLMGPLLGASFGLAVHDHTLFMVGVRNESIALFATVAIGFVMGIIFIPFAEDLFWPTQEMALRGVFAELLFGAIVAVCGGIAVAIAETNSHVSSIVGIAIAAALLPPAVNTGICLAYANVGPSVTPDVDIDQVLFNDIAMGSFTLVLVNVFFIYTAAALVFKLKLNISWKPKSREQLYQN